MNGSQFDNVSQLFAKQRLSRRQALIRGGAGLAILGAASTVALPRRASAQDATPVATETPGAVTAENAARAVDRIPTLVQEILDKTGVPGMSVAVVFDDNVTFLDGFGVRELGGTEKIDADTVFQLASCSKALASTVV